MQNANSYNINDKIANNFCQKPRRHVRCRNCKMAPKLCTFYNRAVLPRVQCGSEKKLREKPD